MKAETLKKLCTKFEERRLNTLRENWICKKVNQNVNQERAARRPPARRPPRHHLFNNRIFLRKTRQKQHWFSPKNQALQFQFWHNNEIRVGLYKSQWSSYFSLFCWYHVSFAANGCQKFATTLLKMTFVPNLNTTSFYWWWGLIGRFSLILLFK